MKPNTETSKHYLNKKEIKEIKGNQRNLIIQILQRNAKMIFKKLEALGKRLLENQRTK